MRCCLLLVVLHATSTVLHSVVEMRLHKQCYCSAPPVHRESLGNAGGRTRGITIPNDARPALSVGSRNANLNGRRRTRPAAAKISASPQFLRTIVCARDPFQAVDVNQVELLRCQSGEPCYTMPCSNAASPTGFHGYQGMCIHEIEMCRRRFDRFRTCKLPSKNVQASHEKVVWLVYENTRTTVIATRVRPSTV